MHLNSKVTIAIRCDDAKEAQLLGGSLQSRFFVQVRHETTYTSSGNKHFFH